MPWWPWTALEHKPTLPDALRQKGHDAKNDRDLSELVDLIRPWARIGRRKP